MIEQQTVTAILLAAGQSARFGPGDKLTAPLGGRTVLEWAAWALFSSPFVDQRVLVAAPGREEELGALLRKEYPDLVTVPGGAARNESSLRGLLAASGDLALIHDGARPFLSPEAVERCVRDAARYGACAAAIPCADTVKLAGEDGMVRETTSRRQTWRVQSPQAFCREALLEAYRQTDPADPALTDDCMVMERAGHSVKLTMGGEENFKITTRWDYAMAGAMGPLLGLWKEDAAMTRTGIGQDSHRTSPPGTPGTMVLGGVPFPEYPPLLANSDGDVVLHALVNAISGVSCENILGERADRICQSGVRDSSVYVGEALRFLTGRVTHVSFTIECKAPKISPRIPEMRRCIGELLGLPPGRVGITATSGEGLTDFGRGDGVSVFCIVTVEG